MNKEEYENIKLDNEDMQFMQDFLWRYIEMTEDMRMEKMIKIDPKYSDDPGLDKHLIITALFKIIDILFEREEEIEKLEEDEI